MRDQTIFGRQFRKRGWHLTGVPAAIDWMPGTIVERILSGPNRGGFRRVGNLKDMDHTVHDGPDVMIKSFVQVQGGLNSGRFPGKVIARFTRANGTLFAHGDSKQFDHIVESSGSKRSLFRNVAQKNKNWPHARWIIILSAWRVEDSLFLRSSSSSGTITLSGPVGASLMGVNVNSTGSAEVSQRFSGWRTVAFKGARVGQLGQIRAVL